MLPIEQARARRHAYSLFGRLFLQPITADLLPYLQSIPDLAAVLPEPFDPDETAAAHHTLFAFNLFPYASIFLDTTRLLGGPVAHQHEEFYRQVGFVSDTAIEPDHLGQCFSLLAYLSELEAGNLEAGQSAEAPRNSQMGFFENHLLPWFVPFVIAVQRQDDPFYGRIAQLSLALIADHYGELRTHLGGRVVQSARLSHSVELPALEDGRTGLRDIARFLVTPVLSGVYIGRRDITGLARYLSLPHGFGRRDEMLQTLLQAAGQYDSTPQLLAALEELVGKWQEAYQQIALDYADTAAFTAPWQTRTDQTQQLLSQMKTYL